MSLTGGHIAGAAQATDGLSFRIGFTIDGFFKPTGRPKTGPRS